MVYIKHEIPVNVLKVGVQRALGVHKIMWHVSFQGTNSNLSVKLILTQFTELTQGKMQ